MRIYITGASGFVGRNLIEEMIRELPDVEIYSLIRSLTGANRELLLDDVLSDQTIGHTEPDVIIHLAGKAHDTKNISDDSEYFEVNYELTKRVYDYFLRSSANKFVFLSSVKAVADHLHEVLIETTDAHPATAYGKSKLAAEKYILSKEESGKKSYILRPCLIYGKGNKGNLKLLQKFVSKGIPYPLGVYKNKRSFLCMDNLSYAIIRIMREDIASGVYNVADDESLSTTELIAIMAQAQEKKVSVLNLPKGLVKSMAWVGDALHLPINSEMLSKMTEEYVVSNEKLKRALKIERFPVSVKEGIQTYL